MTQDELNALIVRYAAGGLALRPAVQGLSRGDCLARPGPGDWSIQELVIHLADSDSVAIDRMRRIIAEENPSLIGFDENKWIRNLFTDEQSIEDAVDLFEINRRQFTRVLRNLGPAAFDRFGTHSERGRVTLLQLLNTYTDHLEHHLKFLFEKRARLGAPSR